MYDEITLLDEEGADRVNHPEIASSRDQIGAPTRLAKLGVCFRRRQSTLRYESEDGRRPRRKSARFYRASCRHPG
jgi:hypothetical protein